jgi:hypothetical protein
LVVVEQPDGSPATTDGFIETPLNNSIYSALTGPHAHFAQRRGNALRYPVDMSPFMALPDSPDDADWPDIAALAGPAGEVTLNGPHQTGTVPATHRRDGYLSGYPPQRATGGDGR